MRNNPSKVSRSVFYYIGSSRIGSFLSTPKGTLSAIVVSFLVLVVCLGIHYRGKPMPEKVLWTPGPVYHGLEWGMSYDQVAKRLPYLRNSPPREYLPVEGVSTIEWFWFETDMKVIGCTFWNDRLVKVRWWIKLQCEDRIDLFVTKVQKILRAKYGSPVGLEYSETIWLFKGTRIESYGFECQVCYMSIDARNEILRLEKAKKERVAEAERLRCAVITSNF